MNLHNLIMNIPVDDQKSQQAWGNADNDCMTIYKLGHRDARHVAAELSLKAEARIEGLEEALNKSLDLLEGMVNPFARGTAQDRHTAVLKFLMENKRCI